MRISRGYRNNNPLNIRRCAKNRWVGLAEGQGDGEFCQFRSMAYGFRAAFVLLRTYGKRYGCNTLRGIISRFAPPAENDAGAYVDFVSHRVGIGARTEKKCETTSHIFTVCIYYCHKLLEPLSQIATVVLLLVKYLPMTTITTTYIVYMWHFC